MRKQIEVAQCSHDVSSSMQYFGMKIQVSQNLQFTKQSDISKKLEEMKIALKITQKQGDQQQQQIPRN